MPDALAGKRSRSAEKEWCELATAFERRFPRGGITGGGTRWYLRGGAKREFFCHELRIPVGLLPFVAGRRRPTYFDACPLFVEIVDGQAERIVFTYVDVAETKARDHFKRYRPLLRRLQSYSAEADAQGRVLEVRFFVVTHRESALASASDAFWSVQVNPQVTATEVHRYFDRRLTGKEVAPDPYLEYLYMTLQKKEGPVWVRAVRDEVIAPLDLAFGPELFGCVVGTDGTAPWTGRLRPERSVREYVSVTRWRDWGEPGSSAIIAPAELDSSVVSSIPDREA